MASHLRGSRWFGGVATKAGGLPFGTTERQQIAMRGQTCAPWRETCRSPRATVPLVFSHRRLPGRPTRSKTRATRRRVGEAHPGATLPRGMWVCGSRPSWVRRLSRVMPLRDDLATRCPGGCPGGRRNQRPPGRGRWTRCVRGAGPENENAGARPAFVVHHVAIGRGDRI